MKTVLISCSLSPKARGMIAAATAFASQMGASMHFCHVAKEDLEIRRRLTLLLNDLGVENPSLIIRPGAPDKIIRQLAKETKVDLIIAGALEHESTLVGILGSVARRLVRKAKCSVMLLTPSLINKTSSIRTIVASVSYDPLSSAMMHVVIDIARHFNAGVRVVHQYDFSLRFLSAGEVGDEKKIVCYEGECAAVESQRLRNFIETFDWRGVVVKGECLKGADGSELSHLVERKQAQLMVIPAPMRISFWQRFFNPPAEVVLQDLPCSIIFYRGRVR